MEPINEGLGNRNFLVTTNSGQFVIKEALPHFRKALAGLVAMPVLEWAVSCFYDDAHEKRPGAKDPAAKKVAWLQGAIAYGLIYEDGIGNESFEQEDKPLTKVAKWLTNEAKEWGIKLPVDLVAKAKKLEEEAAVSTETPKKKAGAKGKPAAKKLSKRAKKKATKAKK